MCSGWCIVWSGKTADMNSHKFSSPIHYFFLISLIMSVKRNQPETCWSSSWLTFSDYTVLIWLKVGTRNEKWNDIIFIFVLYVLYVCHSVTWFISQRQPDSVGIFVASVLLVVHSPHNERFIGVKSCYAGSHGMCSHGWMFLPLNLYQENY
jgi:hypothetical protein